MMTRRHFQMIGRATVCRLLWSKGYTCRDIAAITGINAGTVSRLRRWLLREIASLPERKQGSVRLHSMRDSVPHIEMESEQGILRTKSRVRRRARARSD